MTNCTFSGNKATYRGGAIFNGQRTYLEDQDGSISAAFCTFTGNEVWVPTVDSPAPDQPSACGGAICNLGVISMGSSIVAGNVDHRPGSLENYSPDGWSAEYEGTVLDTSVTPPVWVPYQAHPYFYSHRNNVLGVVDGTVWNIHDQTWGDLRFERAGTEADPLDPLLQDIRLRGNALVHEPLPGSPALDFASAVTSATFFDCPDVDQRGAPRPPDGTGNGSHCDAGAFEVSATSGELEAEDADTGPNFAIWPDPAASGGYAVMAGNGTGNRLDGPDEAYRIRFEVFVNQSGTYNIKAWGQAASIDDNSFWVQVDDDPVGGYLWDMSPATGAYEEYLVSDRGAGAENAPDIPQVRVYLTEGPHTIDFYLREDGARLDKIQIVPEATPMPSTLEAEAAALVTGQFLILSDAQASGGQYVAAPDDYSNTGSPNHADKVAVTVNLSQSGTYLIRADVQATFDDKNSFWVRVDGQPGNGYLWDITESRSGYDPDYVSDRGNGTSANPQHDPVEVQLAAGPHTIEIFAREGGTRLDRIGLELKQEADAKIVSRGKPVTASSEADPMHPALYAVDGYPATYWASLPGDNQWVQVDLQASHRIRRVMLYWGDAFGRDYEIQVSDDGSAWTTLYRKTGSAGGADNLMMDGTGRYVRMQGIAQDAGNGYSLKEFDVYGDTTATGFVCEAGCLNAQLVNRYENAVLNTTGERWFYVTDQIAGWQASESAGRTITVNGMVVAPGQMPLPPKVDGRYYFHFSAGTHPWAAWSFWN